MPNVFHFTESGGEHKAVLRGSCHWQVCVFCVFCGGFAFLLFWVTADLLLTKEAQL